MLTIHMTGQRILLFLLVKDGWVTATGTTLGADDGIGIASQMAILTDKNLKAGKIECLFTVDEESGMTGAINLKADFFHRKNTAQSRFGR